jgi:uncharacterized protein YceK
MTRSACAVFVLSLALTGCGTVGNLREPRNAQVYGGVAYSVAMMKLAEVDSDGRLPGVERAVLALDVAASAVGDTVTLPVAAVAELNRMSDSEPPPSPEEKQYWQRFWGVEEPRPLPVPVESKP